MEKIELKKNVLDLEYNHESHKSGIFLALTTTGILGFFGNILLLKNSLFIIGLFVTLFVILLSVVAYYKCSKRMKLILYQIENL
ncbi:hypothetical protein J4476_00280 [Candidatus Woesearchaeota archaeon]|nr:MAG: hypothetical protein QT09_C0010G0031 [archaeon GW2011_AR18]MBS3161121.1 hypothetical protein [Candidatus Woesearchaeota archaeon]HIH25531.1 hypothetical protein [Nanoarchaeota archaeon]